MERKVVYVYAFQGMADWEIGYLTAELSSARLFRARSAGLVVRGFSVGREPVTTMGGLHLLPDIGIEWVRPEDAALLVLPGGDSWLSGDHVHAQAVALASRFLAGGVPVAAICGATAALARAGLLDDRAHTSNDLSFLRAVAPSYRGASLYRGEGAVRDGNLVTASGLAPLEFAREALSCLDVVEPGTLEAWYQLNRTRSTEWYQKFQAALGGAIAA